MVLETKKLLVSATSDQTIRFWDLWEISASNQPIFTMYADHPKGESISAISTTHDNDYILTGDTAGQMKLWNFKDF